MTLSEKQAAFLLDACELVRHAHSICEVSGCILKVASWTRTAAEQKKLVEAGLSQTMRSKHLVGLAVDFAIIRDGKYLSESPIYQLMGEYWESLGYTWGGRWTFRDIYHFQY